MYRMKHILDYKSYLTEDWKSIRKDKKGNVRLDKKKITNPYELNILNRAIDRIEDENLDLFCGTIPELEDKYKKGIIRQIDTQSLKSIVEDSKSGYGYVNLENYGDEIKPIFDLHPRDIGKGEVLLPCIYSDVRMKSREKREKGDCAIIDDKNNIIYHIEVKSAGSGFKMVFDETKTIPENQDEKHYPYAYSIAKHIVSRYQRDKNDEKETIFIFFDNGLEKRIGNNDVKGFWWVNVGHIKNSKDPKQIEEIAKKLKITNIGDSISKSNGSSFAISSNENGITIHPRN